MGELIRIQCPPRLLRCHSLPVQKSGPVYDEPDLSRLRGDIYRISQARLIRQVYWNRTSATEAVDNLKLARISKSSDKGCPYAARCAKDNRNAARFQ